MIRKMAGTGVLDPAKKWDGGRYSELYPHAEVCVIGGGPAGMAAALSAAAQGLRVILMEARPWLGGSHDWRVRVYGGESLNACGRRLARQVADTSDIRVFLHAPVIDLSGSNQVTAFQVGSSDDDYEQRYIRFTPKSVVVATGTMGRPLVFDQNELPGIMQVGCAWRLARTYGILPGQRAVFSVGDDLGLEAAVDLSDLGLDVQVVADHRHTGQDPFLVSELSRRGIAFESGRIAASAKGKKQVSDVTVTQLNGREARHYDCDLLVASAGLTPVIGPLSTVGATLAFDPYTGFFLPGAMPTGVHAAGRLLGLFDPDALEADGKLAGLKAARDVMGDVALADAETALAVLPGLPAGLRRPTVRAWVRAARPLSALTKTAP